MINESDEPLDSGVVAARLAQGLDERGTEYAIGGAVALGFWGQPRGTMDVDITLFLPKDRPSEVVWELQEIGCDMSATRAIAMLREHGYCSVKYRSVRVDVFVPTNSFYDLAKQRRRRVRLGRQEATVFDAESLAVFKMMFFRPRDIVDLQSMIRIQGARLDRDWVRERLIELVGPRDPRVAQWDELASEHPI
ncbi:MAG: hypothetical protein WEH44_04355 [Pirellulaceae bacterium]